MPEIKQIWSILCESSVIDQETNISSKDKIVSNIGSKKLIPIKCELVSMFERSNAKDAILVEAKVSLFDPDNKELVSKEPIIVPLKFEKGKERIRSRIKFSALPITLPGLYKFKLYFQEGKEKILVGETHFGVKLIISK